MDHNPTHVGAYQFPDASGHFGPYGGSFVSETLTFALEQLKAAYAHYQHDPEFLEEFHYELKHFVGRPSPIYHAKRWSRENGGAQIFFKREDLNHTGAHKINNVIGQALLAKRMGKPRVIAETGGPARCGYCHDLRTLWFGVRGVYGCRGRQAASTKRVPHAVAGCHRGTGGVGLQDIERCVE